MPIRRRQISAVGVVVTALSSVPLNLSCLSFTNTSKANAWVTIPPTSLLHPSFGHRQQRQYFRHRDSRSSVSLARARVKSTATYITATSTASSSTAPTADRLPSSTAIVGGGPTGLAVALMLARRGYAGITVLERLDEPPPPASSQWGNPERSYNLGIGGRGQTALAQLGAADKVLSWCAEAVGRKDWNPQSPEGAERIFTERKYKTKVIARDRLASCLLEEVREKHPDAVTVRFGVECTSAKWLELHGGTGGTLTLEKSHTSPLTTSASEIPASSSTSGSDRKGAEQHEELTAELVIAADGVRSAIRDGLEGDRQLTRTLSGGEEVRVKKFPKSNDFVYKVVPFKLDQGWRNDFNYSHRTKGDITLESLPTKEGMQVGVLLFRPDDQRVLGLTSGSDARALFEELFPQFANMISDHAYERLAQQKVSRLPTFSYAGPALHLGKSAVLLGDAIKSVKPYFGLGVNTALEDCLALDRCLEETGDDLSKALPMYSRMRASEAKDLVELSRGFDRTGVTGFFGFVVPLILDSIFHTAAPAIFAPNTIAFLQKEGTTFRQIRLRKGLDRVMQGVVLGTVGGLMFAVIRMGSIVLWPLVAS